MLFIQEIYSSCSGNLGQISIEGTWVPGQQVPGAALGESPCLLHKRSNNACCLHSKAVTDIGGGSGRRQQGMEEGQTALGSAPSSPGEGALEQPSLGPPLSFSSLLAPGRQAVAGRPWWESAPTGVGAGENSTPPFIPTVSCGTGAAGGFPKAGLACGEERSQSLWAGLWGPPGLWFPSCC